MRHRINCKNNKQFMLFFIGVISIISLLRVISAISLLKVGKDKLFISKVGDSVVLTNNYFNAVDFTITSAKPSGIPLLLGTGISYLSYNPEKMMLKFDRKTSDNKSLLFKIVLSSRGTYLLQHEYGCVGMNSRKTGFDYLTVVDCDETDKIFEFLIVDIVKGRYKDILNGHYIGSDDAIVPLESGDSKGHMRIKTVPFGFADGSRNLIHGF